MPEFVPIAAIDAEAIERLLDRAFGTDRHARTAYKVRAGTAPIAALSFALVDDTALAGTIQCWPVALAGDDGSAWPLVMVGPVAIDPPRQNQGLGHALMAHMLAAADATGDVHRLMLVGDPDYYGRFFGFTAAQTGQWRLPGPFERHRLLARGADIPDLPGLLGPRPDA
ncbi:MAG TPA: N-acetyltransferase [Sphingomonas sp.]|nr:N-acetyltransferase [Sphingomonas sp.]